jgi:LIM domain
MSGSKKCPGCGKTVYFAEKIDGVSQASAGGPDWWHRPCFKCAKCAVSLQPGNFKDHDGKIFCSKCYGAEIKLQGYGYGNSLESFQDHGNAETELDTSGATDYPLK